MATATSSSAASNSTKNDPEVTTRLFLLILVLLISGAILRSAIATRLDGFTMDEAYHTVAGVSYVQRGDFRINPEHPPLVKLWVGSIISALGFHLSPFREIHDKPDEREFVNDDTYLHNDPVALQHHARIAMWTFNGLLMVAFALALRRVFGPLIALGAILFLAIDPTVAAHLPVVMTDLPIALLSATAVVLAGRAFRDWLWPDLVGCSVVLGLALATKHSAPVICIVLAMAGLGLAFIVPLLRPRDFRWRRLAQLSGVLLGSIVILWSFYLFRFAESDVGHEVFNRPLADKIADLRSPVYRFALTHLNEAHVLPRAYIWGLADTVRGGLEGRAESRLVFGRPTYNKTPAYFFPGVVAVKLPIGLGVLFLIGAFLFLTRRLPTQWNVPAGLLLFTVLCFFVVLTRGASYAGVRHALPALVILSIFAGFAVYSAVVFSSKTLRALVLLAFVAAAASALPVLRPWEYFNELIGGKERAYLYFNDEGIDLYQRHKELARYYHEVVKPTGEVPFIEYLPFDQEANFLGLDWVGRDPKRDEPRFQNRIFSGTVIVEGRYLGPRLFGDWSALRAAKPAARFGNLVVFRGTFDIGPIMADNRYWMGMEKLFAQKPNLAEAERFFRQSADLDPSAFWTFIELGNIYLSRGSREEAVSAYESARDHAPAGSVFRRSIEDQVRLISTKPLSQVPALRDPSQE